MPATYENQCIRTFPETGKFKTDGTPERIVIDRRKMILRGDFIITKEFEINYMKRAGEWWFYVRYWDTPTYNRTKDIIKKGSWIQHEKLTLAQLRKWLLPDLGKDAERAIIELMTMAPTNLKEKEAA